MCVLLLIFRPAAAGLLVAEERVSEFKSAGPKARQMLWGRGGLGVGLGCLITAAVHGGLNASARDNGGGLTEPALRRFGF